MALKSSTLLVVLRTFFQNQSKFSSLMNNNVILQTRSFSYHTTRRRRFGDNEVWIWASWQEIADVEPLVVTLNNKGEAEGVKYDRIGVVAINAIKEQQAQIEALQKTVDEQRRQLELLKLLVC